MNAMNRISTVNRSGLIILCSFFILGGCAGTSSETRYDTDTRVYTASQNGVKSKAGQYDDATARYVAGKNEGAENYSTLYGGNKSTVGPYHDATALYTLRQKGSVPHSEAIKAGRGQLAEGRQGATKGTAEQGAVTPPMILELNDVLFEFDKWVIKEPFLPVLDEWVDYFKNNPSVKAQVYGYTDSTGPGSYNQKLSEKRAQAVVDYLVAKGISPERLTAGGFGENKPAASNSTKDGRQKNRRVEMEL